MNPTPPGADLLDDVAVFAREMIASKDLDPLYPVLAALYNRLELDTEQRLWFTYLYLAYYDLPSAFAAFKATDHKPDYLPEWCAHLRCATERRNNRGGKVRLNVAAYVNAVRAYRPDRLHPQAQWVSQGWGKAPYQNYERFWTLAQSLWGNGRWAAFKWSELLSTVHNLNLEAPDMRMAYCSGPREGLAWLYHLAEDAPLDHFELAGSHLRFALAQRGVIGLPWEQLETILCNVNSLRKGKYYVGHDIDELDARLSGDDPPLGLTPADQHLLWQVFYQALPEAYSERRATDKTPASVLCKLYRDEGKIMSRPREGAVSYYQSRHTSVNGGYTLTAVT